MMQKTMYKHVYDTETATLIQKYTYGYFGDPAGYDLVCANILGHLLITFRFNIASWVKPGGKLVLAGILARDFDRVSESFVEIGFTEVERETIKEWTGGTFVKR